MDCKTFQNELPDLVLNPGARPSLVAVAHLKKCPPCSEEYLSFQATFATLDSWTAPEPTAYFDQKLSVRLREEQAQPRMGFLDRMKAHFLFNTGRSFRPAMAGALAVAMIAGGGSLFLPHSAQPSTPTSATVNDLQILDRNEQAFQQFDELQQDDDNQVTPASPSLPTDNSLTSPTT